MLANKCRTKPLSRFFAIIDKFIGIRDEQSAGFQQQI